MTTLAAAAAQVIDITIQCHGWNRFYFYGVRERAIEALWGSENFEKGAEAAIHILDRGFSAWHGDDPHDPWGAPS